MFSGWIYGWIYDQLKPHAAELKVAHPLMLRAIAAAKKKNDLLKENAPDKKKAVCRQA